MIYLKGKVKSGLGEASYWVKKIEKNFYEKCGIKLFPGTLNVDINQEYVLQEKEKIYAKEYGGKYDVLVQKCEIFKSTAYIVRPELNNMSNGNHPLNLIEIVSDKNLRKEYDLKDNDEIIIVINN